MTIEGGRARLLRDGYFVREIHARVCERGGSLGGATENITAWV